MRTLENWQPVLMLSNGSSNGSSRAQGRTEKNGAIAYGICLASVRRLLRPRRGSKLGLLDTRKAGRIEFLI